MSILKFLNLLWEIKVNFMGDITLHFKERKFYNVFIKLKMTVIDQKHFD